MCNDNISNVAYCKEVFSKELDMDEDYLRDLSNLFYDNNIDLVRHKLKNLEDKKIITVNEDNYNVVICGEHRLATQQEKSYILELEKEALKKCGLKEKEEVFYKHRENQYRITLNRLLKKSRTENNENIQSFYKVFMIGRGENFTSNILSESRLRFTLKNMNLSRINQFRTNNMKYIDTIEDENLKEQRIKDLDIFIETTIDIDYQIKYSY